MSHWTTDVFVEKADLYKPELRASIGPADREIQRLLDLLGTEHDLQPATALDVACGIGRHLVPLAERDLDVTGVDLSPEFVEEARERVREAGVGDSVEVVERDMRDLDAVGGTYDLVTNLWTSFGFFDDETNREVLEGFRERTADGGALVMDLADRDGVLANFDSDSVFEADDSLVTETREYDPTTGRMHSSRETFERKGEDLEYRGSLSLDIRLYSPVELRERLLDAGFDSVALYGGQDGEDLGHESMHQVAVARP